MSRVTQEPLNLDALEDVYDISGELAGRRDARQLLATRRADGMAVTIALFRPPADDEGNALSHLAADVNRLVGNGHPNLVPVLEGRWVGTDAFAIVTPRVTRQTLGEVLSRREEDFSYPRIAAILREINSVLEWARERKFVHRAVELDTIYLDEGSDRVHVAFALRALPRTGMPSAADDARNVALLARAMLTRSPVAPERDDQPLAELRPGLPRTVLQRTEALLAPTRDRAQAPPDVTTYISMLAMAEDLKRGEQHVEKSRNAIKEAHRKAKAQIEAERGEHERQLAAARKEHERLVSEQARKFEKERAEFEAELERQRQALAKEREALAALQAAHARDTEALARERAAHKRDCEVLARERAAHREEAAALAAQLAEHRRAMEEERRRLAIQLESLQKQSAEERKQLQVQIEAQQREAAEERKRIAAQLAELKRQTAEERQHAAAQLAARLEEQKWLAADEKKRLADQLALEKQRAAEERKRLAAQFAAVVASAPTKPPARKATPVKEVDVGVVAAPHAAGHLVSRATAPTPPTPPKPQKPPKPPKPSGPRRGLYGGFVWNRNWNTPAAAAGVLLLLGGVTLVASANRDENERPTSSPPAATVAPSNQALSSTAPNVIVVDSIGGGVTGVPDSTRATIRARPRTQSDDRPRVSETPTYPQTTTPPPVRNAAPAPAPISAFDLMGVSPIPLREGNTRLDSVGRPSRDTTRRDQRRDSAPPSDIVPGRDTIGRP